MNFEGRVAIVTGAGQGLGRAHAMSLARYGARVVVNDLGGEAAAVTGEIAAAGGTAIADTSNVVCGGAAIVEAALSHFGRLDIIVCNAGIMKADRFAEGSEADWQRVFDVHFQGTVDVCRAGWPHLAASGSGRIVTTASNGMMGGPGLTAYGAGKGAIFSLTRSLAIEGAPLGINANCVLPSAWTPMAENMGNVAVREMMRANYQPEHVAAFVTWLAHQDTTVTNEAFQVSAGRASRLVMAAAPFIRADASTPEAWAAKAAELLAPDSYAPVFTTEEMVHKGWFDIAPELRVTLDKPFSV